MATIHETSSQASNLEHEVASGRTRLLIAAESNFLNSLSVSNPQSKMQLEAKNVIKPIDIELDSIISQEETKMAAETAGTAPGQDEEAKSAPVEGEEVITMMHDMEIAKRREIAEMFSGVQALEHEE